ncbi:dynein heavy chain 9, axonemal [Synchiropus splendidus]|uniref:dynein heavy chain 9, axonemal n=1 Tax=Synchiropus splendidus TaxID=270530 RepID=UPI00237E2CFC|nr:dynein heavy chain 9, axonemal [Synchiropus splendidus]XP_053720929.1 dynein heavy chain 9, axonemal [Synchiropus splendidus]
MGKEKEPEVVIQDKRLDYLGEFVQRALKVKQDKWQKCLVNEEQRMVLMEFLDKPEPMTLVVSLTQAGLLEPATELSTAGKGVYFMKKTRAALAPDTYKNQLIFGDLSDSPLEQFCTVFLEAVDPLLSNRKNQAGWPEVVSQEIQHAVQSFRRSVLEVLSHVQGKPLLPFLTSFKRVDQIVKEMSRSSKKVDAGVIHALESAVFEWSHQIRVVLEKDSSEALMGGKNPTPDAELQFWKSRNNDLKSINNVLTSPDMKKMKSLLEAAASSYCSTFNHIRRNVIAALEESEDICKYLRTMEYLFEDMENEEFPEIQRQIGPLMHTVCLVWTHSWHYNVPARLIVLLQEIINLLIQQTQAFLAPDEILVGEVLESLQRVDLSLDTLKLFKDTYEDRRNNLDKYKTNGSAVKLWDFPSFLIFSRLDSFFERINTIKGILLTAVDFEKLEKIEIGGLRGQTLNEQVQSLNVEFTNLYKCVTEKPYDCLDLSNEAFEKDVKDFQLKVDDIDRRLGAVFCQAFDDVPGFEVLDMFGTLLRRPLVDEIFMDRYPCLVTMFDKNLDSCKFIYNCQIKEEKERGSAWVGKNMPPLSGGLRWARQLKQSIQKDYNRFQQVSYPCLESEEGCRVTKKYDEMMELLKKYSDNLYEKWTSSVGEVSLKNLNLPLISRDPSSQLISVNFNPQLSCVLREMKYLQAWHIEDIPETAVQIYSNREQLWKYQANLDILVSRYNKVIQTVNPVERPLIQSQLDSIDSRLTQAENHLNWNCEGIWQYIQEMRDTMCDLESRLQTSKDNVELIKRCMNSWAKPMFKRKEGKRDSLLSLGDRAERIERFYTMVRTSGEKIHLHLKSNLELFKADSSSNEWKAYVEYIDNLLISGFAKSIKCSLKFFQDNTEQRSAPLFEARLDLQVPNLVFIPPLDLGARDNFSDLVDRLITDVFKMSTLVPRINQENSFPHYEADMESNSELSQMRQLLNRRVEEIMEVCCKFRSSLECYSYLYVDSRKDCMSQFLRYSRVLTSNELNSDSEIPEKEPTLDNFKEQVDKYEKIYNKVQAFKSVHVFQGWMQVDARHMKSSLLNIIKRWSFMFKQYLMDRVTNSLSDLEEFIKTTKEGLGQKVEEGDYDGLVGVMGHLLAVKDRQKSTDTMFEPLKQTIALLWTYKQELPDEVHVQLEELPEKWINVKKKALQVKQQVAPLQEIEVTCLRKKCASFDVQQHTFRERFRNTGFFRFDCEEAMELLNEFHQQILEQEGIMASLVESASLFEINLNEYRQLKQCRREVVILKELWDLIIVVDSTMKAWMQTRWREINVEDMEMECKNFSKDIRGLDKESRAWDAFTGLDSKVKNLLISLRAVGELQNPAIRPRHWQDLMNATGVTFSMDKDTTLADLLQLNLHNFEEEVRGIVDKSVKEMGMEKVLIALDSTWTNMEFKYEPHERTGLSLLRFEEELIETLEENQVQLQNITASKYIGPFEERLTTWQTKLSIADSVISIWFEVQRTWTHLESIFIGSEDIRTQLPEDSKCFEGIDSDFKGLAAGMEATPNVLIATNKPGLFDKLDDIQTRLAMCEKALAEYLDTKRLAFPRFYFISSADLLDIMSNGTNPYQVQKHLSKLFDNMLKMKFGDDASGNPTKDGLGMYSKEEEYVPFDKICDCTGQVEAWLNRVMDRMRATVRHEMTDAVVAYEDKPREQWLFDYPAQVALTCTQIWWTTDVGMAFARLEEGFENAMKQYYKKQIAQLNTLITLLIGELTPGDRQKVMTICTIDVHARDVVAKMIAQKLDNSQAFLWLSQLRHRWCDKEKHCFANICDAQFLYSYEYLGNTPRLVITPLTDRCYITLTQSLHLTMSGAPAGPAGTGKTETTKDLGRALGIMVYVFNCSEQMDYKSCGNIYKGLAQTGAWGCFDEFNRISVEVLSVVAVQVKSIQDAIRDKKKRFNFMGEEVNLVPSVGIFITMNPGYAGRTELPENLKALFRPCAMVVPDFELICEIMLVAEGFITARILARKFITLYTLCKELLSKQDHYDWGLRAIKSVLVVAGSLKRGDPERAEDQVLMRALRDFNIPKIVTDDMPVFMGLIGDLFPAVDVPRKRDLNLEEQVKKSVVDLKLQPDDNFVLKVVQLEELLAVRHSVFVIGNAGTGKSQVWKSLQKTYKNLGRKAVWVDLNPKAVTNDELFGIINPATREWKDGLFSCVMRDLANVTHNGPKWIVLDGDIDPMWIESLNTVMDDNKVLTLASNERIPLNPTMRLVFEISHLRTATPATVSRAGILYINPADLGWNPPVSSWIDKREVQSEKAILTILFDKYLPSCLDALRFRFKKIVPIPEQSVVQMLCYLLECLLTAENTPPDSPKDLYELYFVFATIWACGGALFQDQLIDYRVEFSKWWVATFKSVKFPNQGTVFDYYIDPESKKFEPWSRMVPKFEMDPDMPLQACLVHTTETIRVRYFMDRLLELQRPVMLVGNAGTGKSVLVGNKLGSLDPEKYMIKNVPFNYYTTSLMLQAILEKPLEKKAGRNYGPPGTRKLVYFIDDMNMPEVDEYGTVQPHTLIRQHMDYSHWYDRYKLILKNIYSVQYVACMNPTSGSFTINPRLQRHFSVFALSFPGNEALGTIYTSILSQHLQYDCFTPALQKSGPNLVQLALAMHQRISVTFLPTAVKFHYVFTLRDLSNIFQGILFCTGDCLKTPQDLLKVYLHESNRVYRDHMVEDSDFEAFDKLQIEMVKKFYENIDETLAEAKNMNVYCHFAQGLGDAKYLPVESWESLNKNLLEVLDSYNEVNATINLVLFEDAMAHICRINRILESPRGNALLVGVGGSGKQSLTRMAAFISSLEVFQITLRKGYAIPDLKTDLASLYVKAGLKSIGTVFLMTDAQVAEEKFLVLVNDLLATGEIPDLFPDDEVDKMINGVRSEVRGAGILDTNENCWKFFIDRVRRQLKVALCFSPVGSTLRVRSRKFPAVVNCATLDWFHEWPQEALESVSFQFLQEAETIAPDLKESVSKFMAYVHTTVNMTSKEYLVNDRRYNYTTPKSFLEQIKLYRSLLDLKSRELTSKVERLENGLQKLNSTTAQVDDLKAKLAAQEVELKQKNEDADKLIQVVGVETDKVSKKKAVADEEERKVGEFAIVVSGKQRDCEEDLAKAEPALEAAQKALDTLDKNNLTELKSFGSPVAAVTNVTAAVMVLTAPKGKVPKDRSWKAAKIMMAKVDVFLDSLKNYDKENIPDTCLKAIQPYLQDAEFNPDLVKAKSSAAAGLCSWVINIVTFYNVYCDVEPKRQALAKANSELAAAQEKLAGIKSKINRLNENLAKLTAKFEKATADKLKCQQEAEETEGTISLANRLVGGLASENVRWAESVNNFRKQERTMCGDVLLITAFISYLGYFTKAYRLQLMDQMWRPYLSQLKVPIPVTEDLDPLTMLTDDADIAAWQNEGLPADRMSTENATILTSCERWPLMVDPQLQGIKWIKSRYSENLQVIRIEQRGYLDAIERALSEGNVVLIENLEETLDPVLGPLLSRETIKKGRYIKMGDKECEYNPKFRLILHTKLANPHYQPELQAQCTLINFTVTRDGLEDQLLAAVVSMERPDLEELKANLTKQQNGFKVTLKTLEDNLLSRLSAASGNFLGDTELVSNLETTKRTATEIEEKVKEAKITEVKINDARECYRPAAARASLLYFIMNDLNKIHPMYQFSLKAFSVVFQKAVQKATPDDELKQRVLNLIDSITSSVFQYTTRGLFECDKLTYIAQLAFQILLMNKELNPEELDFLLRYPVVTGVDSPVDFLTHFAWGGIKSLCSMDEFRNLDRDIEGSANRWKRFVECECPEKEKFPMDWKNKNSLQRMCMMRILRPDRMMYAVRDFVEEKLGNQYVAGRSLDFAVSYEESGPATPMFFILSPGVDPLKDVEKHGKRIGFTFDNRNFHNVSLGQGQEIVAEQALLLAAKEGHWVILQNIHLVAKWLGTLEKLLEQLADGSHENFRVFVSAEPSGTPESHIIPQGILENSIKITNEPPTGMHANLHKALDNFNQETLEQCTWDNEFKSILFALCYFHAVVAERRKFGPQGWNRSYPFNTGDLTISVNVLYNYLEANSAVPYDDLRYLFGEIMYGGHITDDWDRRLCITYLQEYIKPEMMSGEMTLAPGFILPENTDYNGYHQYIDDNLPPESPYLYGLHPNAEIGFLTQTSDNLFRTLLEMQPRDGGGGEGGGMTREEKVQAELEELMGKLPDEFNMTELLEKAEDRTPYQVVALQECERMNFLTQEIRRSLHELCLGLKGELTMTPDMENLQNAVFFDQVPDSWTKRAYPSLSGLAIWFSDLMSRIKELEVWSSDFALPPVVWLAGFFNPQSFLTAIMQAMARRNEWPLDSMTLQCDVTKKNREDFSAPPREGAYVHGLFMEGARWDTQTGMIVDARLKELTPAMPVIFIRAIPADKVESKNVYQCPVYKTRQRGFTYIWTFNLKTKENPAKWTLAGVALLLQI